ncbi:MAG: hypothetical protein FI688_06210 [SAR202 cluster bacterium]|nr:hypothetical protein [Chloroflexota bacterium]MQG23048.1 hypothetical protein [SAR202 cluster bacterium]
MSIMHFLSDIRNAAIANSVIVIFHIWVAFAIEGIDFLVIVIPVGVLIAGAYYFKGKIGAALLAIPTLGYLLVVPDLIEGLTTGPDADIGYFIYVFAPFWLLTILVNILTVVVEARGTSKYSNS